MCTSYIRRHITRLPRNHIFKTREFLSYGSRTAVDQVLFRMVRSGLIIRLARGVFVREGSKIPELFEIARAKAGAFGKQILRHCNDVAFDLGLTAAGNAEPTFATSGSSSSFLAGATRVHLRHIGPRKVHLGESQAGKALRSLWHLGRGLCKNFHIVSTQAKFLLRSDRDEFRQSIAWMPTWMTRLIEVSPVFPEPALWDPPPA